MLKYILTQKTQAVLDLIGYDLDREFRDTSKFGWVIGNTGKFVALGMSKQEGLDRGFIEIKADHPLYILAQKNSIIPVEWIIKLFTSEQFVDWAEKSRGSTRSEYGIYAHDVRKYIEMSGL